MSELVIQQHLDALHTFVGDIDLTVNLGKTVVMTYNTSTLWITRSAHMLRRRWSMSHPMFIWG